MADQKNTPDLVKHSVDEYYPRYARSMLALVFSGSLSEERTVELRAASSIFGENFTTSIDAILDIDCWDDEIRQQFLLSAENKLQMRLHESTTFNDPRQAAAFCRYIWEFCRERALLKNEAISFFSQFSEDEPGDFPHHIHTPHHTWTLIYIDTGAIELDCGEDVFTIDAGQMYLCTKPCNLVYYRNKKVGECSLFVSTFSPRSFASDLLEKTLGLIKPHVLASLNDDFLRSLVKQSIIEIIEISHSNLSQKKELHVLHIHKILVLMCDVVGTDDEAAHLDKRLRFACEFIRENYTNEFTVDDVCQAANASYSTLSMLFRAVLNMKIMEWRDQLRIQKAKQLLINSDMSIKHIAISVGYSDPLFFSRRFKQLTGWSPTLLREFSDS